MGKLGARSRLLDTIDNPHTKQRILMEATKLFALKGYGSVSIREIARAIGIKPASIYSHYRGKEDLLKSALSNICDVYNDYFRRLAEANKNAETLEQVLDNMFLELYKVVDIYIYYGLSLLQQQKYTTEAGFEMYYKLFHVDSVNYIAQSFEHLAERGIIPRFDAKGLAAFFMNAVLVNNELRLYEHLHEGTDLGVSRLYQSLQHYFLDSIQNGFPKVVDENMAFI